MEDKDRTPQSLVLETPRIEEQLLPSALIWVVDDEKVVGDIAERSLRVIGKYRNVSYFPDSEQALARFNESVGENKTPDLIISDFSMPGLNGGQMLEKIKEIADSSESIRCPAFLLMSGDPSVIKPETLKELGIPEVISKPFNIREFSAIVRQRIEQHFEEFRG